MATDLFTRTMERAYADPDQGALMREVWSPTPWMMEVFTGRTNEGREREMIEWCHATFGTESSPIHEMKGTWRRGNATINGWTWFGFASEQQMQQFAERWPAPADAA